VNIELSERNMEAAIAITEQSLPVERKSSEEKIVLFSRGLHKAFGGQVVLNDISLALRQGEVVLLRGENGSGKTTLLNILTGNLEPDKGEIQVAINGTKEAFTFPRQWWEELNPFDHFTPERLAWEGVGRVWQDIRLFPTMKTLDNVAVASGNRISENPIMAFYPGAYRREKENKKAASKWLEMLGLGDRRDSSCDKISLGQMKRVAIARAIQAGAKVLFLDEPLSGLDEKGITDVINYLQMLVKDHAITFVIVEHSFNIPRVMGIVDKVWSLSRASETREGYNLSVSEPHSLNMENEKGRNALHDLLKVIVGDNYINKPEDLNGGARITTAYASNHADTILEIKNLKVKRGIRTIFESSMDAPVSSQKGLSLTLKKGQISILEAPNGWGKSTLLDAITRVHNNNLEITSGSIMLKGKDITTLQTHQIARMGLSYLRANQQAFASLKINEQMKLIRSSNFLFNSSLDGNSKGNSLSGGEKQKLLIDLLPDADVYLLDEPMIGLDEQAIISMKENIIEKVKKQKAILITIPYSTHNM
jgi:branched-chain amino acid transport system ATP-binding protein